jgi:hypothetical protein
MERRKWPGFRKHTGSQFRDIVPIESVAIFAKLLVQYSLDKATNGGVADK